MCIVTFGSIPIFAFEARRNSHYIIMDIFSNYIKPRLCKNKSKNSINLADYIEREDSEANIDDEDSPLLSSEHWSGSTTSSSSSIDDAVSMYCENWISRLIESALIICTAAVVALYLTNLNWCLSLVGATYGCYIAYFVPSIVFWKCISDKNNKELSHKLLILKCMAIISILYGIIVCVLGVTMAFI
eukprot:UN06913